MTYKLEDILPKNLVETMDAPLKHAFLEIANIILIKQTEKYIELALDVLYDLKEPCEIEKAKSKLNNFIKSEMIRVIEIKFGNKSDTVEKVM